MSANTLQTLTDPSEIEPVIAGTLALMSHYPARQCVCMSEKISHNLALLANCPHLSPPFKSLCDRLKTDWDEIVAQKYAEIVTHQLQHAALH